MFGTAKLSACGLVTGLIMSLATVLVSTATAADGPAEWDRGCEDAKIGSYDRSRHSDDYEEGWQDCNKN